MIQIILSKIIQFAENIYKKQKRTERENYPYLHYIPYNDYPDSEKEK